ncbi:RNA recognition motif domain-containing protein [Aspergillus homomorphus CBS 101889]|uniref:RRM domain-containing protein n=1 Tax=Aspergillus homomorphus (strain CBS 101889) TaxID=1450537 RepID=A0A395HXA0_ASPHC|nr:hypothetical protein BO97DRAFT_348624 [Aspergillus homomorphus CBS 101889]RAL10864.1 hypothetical protein BO97DRAFT_348624 [Aspergillus homomorphus CBS 101889]
MLKPFQIRDLHRSPSPSSSTEAADHLTSSRRRGIVQLSASQYDNLSSSHPRARLTYFDEDDEEIITVGSSLELSQRLDEPIDVMIDTMLLPQTASEPMHIFDIRRSNSVTELWKKYECKPDTQEAVETDDGPNKSTPEKASSKTTIQAQERSDSPQENAHSAGTDESQSLLAAFEAEMTRFLNTPQPTTESTPSAEASTASQSNSDSRPTRPQNATEAFTHAMQSLVDGAELLSSGVMSRIPEIERQLQHAQRAIPENVGSSVQGALATLEAQLRQVTSSLNKSSAMSAQAAHIFEGELPTAASTVESLRSMASELGNVGHTLFEAFEAELGCNRTRPQNLESDRDPDATQADSMEASSEPCESTTDLDNAKSSTKEKNEAKDAGVLENPNQHRMPSDPDTSGQTSEPSTSHPQPVRLPDVQFSMHPLHHPPRHPHPRPPPNHHHYSHAHHHAPFFHHPPPHWSPLPVNPLAGPSWGISGPSRLDTFAHPPAPPSPPSLQTLINHSLPSQSQSHRGPRHGRPRVGRTISADAPPHNAKVPQDVSPIAPNARDVRSSEVATLFIGNVGFGVSERMIRNVFASKGFLVDVHLPQESGTGKHAGFGYLQLPSMHAARAALDALQGEHIDGHAINLEFSDHSPILGLPPQKTQSQPESNNPLPNVTAHTIRPSEPQGSAASSAGNVANEASLKRAVPLTVADLCQNDNRKHGDGESSLDGLKKSLDQGAERLDSFRSPHLSEETLQPSSSNSNPSTLPGLTTEVEQLRFPPVSQTSAEFCAMRDHSTTSARGKAPEGRPEDLEAGMNVASWDIPGTFHQETSDDTAKPSDISSHHQCVSEGPGVSLGPHRNGRRSGSMKHHRSSLKGLGASNSAGIGPSRHPSGRLKPGFHLRGKHHGNPEGSSSQRISPEMHQKMVDACMATLVDLGYGGASEGGLQRIAVYAAAADGNVHDAIDMIEEERKAYEQQGSTK